MSRQRSRPIGVLAALAGVCALSPAAAGDRQASPDQIRLRHELLVVEDARAPGNDDLARLTAALREPSPSVQRQAVRALGRLERPALVDAIAPMLEARDSDIRAEAANALAQSLFTLTAPGSSGARASAVSAILTARLDVERDPAVSAAILTALGRLPFEAPADIETVERRLTMAWTNASKAEGAVTRLGAARALDWLSRLRRRTVPMSDRTAGVLSEAVTAQSRMTGEYDVQTRRFAIAALNNAKRIERALVETALGDPDDQVRRLAAAAAGIAEDLDGRADLLRRALKDGSFMVRYDALRAWGRRLQSSDCGPIRDAAADANAHVALAALDLLGDACPDPALSIQLLAGSADSQDWHRAAHAFVSLARVSNAEADSRLERFAANPVWQVRMYAARAAGEIGAIPTLQRLSTDESDNVREAAITALRKVSAHEADATYIASLGRGDYQLIQTAADALEGSAKRKEATGALFASFDRLTAQRRDNSRDPRMAIVKRLGELGSVGDAPALRPCLRDFDPVLAAECASVLTAWTGQAQTASPQAPKAVVVPEMSEMAAMGASVARIAMRGAGTFELRLFADEAPMTVERFVRLARAGYYNGLTFHRVVPNFVIQGGSPGANEYVGDADFLRDEVGDRTHARGTLGISSRGRDTGDAQIFVNLADNPRLDHAFTVFAEVSRGMDVVDRIVEGDVIETIAIVRGDAATLR